ncbi:hypothetical protein CC80DRAFT_192933 [Byssothecium circinans]|uniref:Uncharacterized protein n=1 Tax=Byssothecium circinans TaxID=147558 RepID=A0A6A5TJA8_9PLEO|nr:hypothetical protein CC80DRAFT_192933 [Byssothecium circinans]
MAPPPRPKPATTEPTSQTYNIILAKPRFKTPTLLRDIENSNTAPVFIGEHTTVVAEQSTSRNTWSHILIFTAKRTEDRTSPPLSETLRLEQSFELKVDSETAFPPGIKRDLEGSQQEPHGIKVPRDLSNAMARLKRKRKNDKRKEGKLFVLSFIEFSDDVDVEEARKELASVLSEAHKSPQDFTAVHNFLAAIQTRCPSSDDESPVPAFLKTAHVVSLMSFPDEKHYAAFRAWFSGDAKETFELLKSAEGSFKFEESVVLMGKVDLLASGRGKKRKRTSKKVKKKKDWERNMEEQYDSHGEVETRVGLAKGTLFWLD